MIVHLTTPLDEAVIRELRVGDPVTISGRLFTARDAAHRRILEIVRSGECLPFDPSGAAMYHCGPVVRSEDGSWAVVSAGPTTSARMEATEAEVLRVLGTRLVIGKGGMGAMTLAALADLGAVYAHFTGGAGALAARSVREVTAVHWLAELGMPEAVWIVDVDRFGPLTVTMDAHGTSLYEDVERAVNENLMTIRDRIEIDRTELDIRQ